MSKMQTPAIGRVLDVIVIAKEWLICKNKATIPIPLS
jgi:hypothetical protein